MADVYSSKLEKDRVFAEARKLSSEADKLEAEALKLRAEARDLDRTPWQRPGAWVAVGSGVVALVAGLLAIPSGYFNRLKTIADQQQQISKQETELSALKVSMADQKLVQMQGERTNLQNQISADTTSIKELESSETKARNDLNREKEAFVQADKRRGELERAILARSEADAALGTSISDPNKSLLLAIHGAVDGRTAQKALIPETVDALRQAIFASSRVPIRLSGFLEAEEGAVAWSPDATKLAISRDDTVVYDTTTWLPVKLSTLDKSTSLAWSDNGTLLMAVPRGLFRVHIQTGIVEHAFIGNQNARPTLFAFSKDLREFLVYSIETHQAAGVPGRIPDFQTAIEVRRCAGTLLHFVPDSQVYDSKDAIDIQQCSMVFSDPGVTNEKSIDFAYSVNSKFSRLAVERGGHLFIVEIGTGKVLNQTRLSAVEELMDKDQLGWSPQDTYLYVNRKNGKIEVFKADSLQPSSPAEAPDFVMSADWSSDNRYAILANPFGLNLFDPQRSAVAFRFRTAEGLPTNLSVSPNGSLIMVQGIGTRATVYSLKVLGTTAPEDLLRLAKARVVGELTTHDCQQLLHLKTCSRIP